MVALVLMTWCQLSTSGLAFPVHLFCSSPTKAARPPSAARGTNAKPFSSAPVLGGATPAAAARPIAIFEDKGKAAGGGGGSREEDLDDEVDVVVAAAPAAAGGREGLQQLAQGAQGVLVRDIMAVQEQLQVRWWCL